MDWKYFIPKFEYEQSFNDWHWPWAGHKHFAYDFIRNINPKIIVELGTHRGSSFFSMCQAVKDNKLPARLFAIDHWKGDKHAGKYDNQVFEAVNDIKNKYYHQLKINLIRKTFDDATVDFKDSSIDLLHIDGRHTYKDVTHDFETWFTKVKNDGIIFLHDIAVREKDFGVYKLWKQLKSRYKVMEFDHSFGLGILFRNPKTYHLLKNYQSEWNRYYPIEHERNYWKNSTHLLRQLMVQITSLKFYRLWKWYSDLKISNKEKKDEDKNYLSFLLNSRP